MLYLLRNKIVPSEKKSLRKNYVNPFDKNIFL